jgi:hypothetical protein
MGKVSILLLLVSTGVVIATFVNGLGTVREPDAVLRHATWGLAALFAVLAANFFAMFHAAQSDRLIRALRRALLAEQEKLTSGDDGEPRA